MPELPEVEIVKQSLNKKIKQKKIKKVIIKNRNLRLKIPVKFEEFLKNKIVRKVTRFSKYIILNFSDGSFCLIHLGMSGTIHLIEKNILNKFTNTSFYNSPNLPIKHNHVEIQFKDLRVIYNDPRRFGFFKFINNNQELKKKFSHLGPEPFSKSYNSKYLLKYFFNKKKDIKSFLLDQKFVSGIGNIYACEILFMCKIIPTKKVMKLSQNECNKIVLFSRSILKKLSKKEGQVSATLKIFLVKVVIFKKSLKFTKEKT